jgi:hypothetical protein
MLKDSVKSPVVVCFFVKFKLGFEIPKHAIQRVQRQRGGINRSPCSRFRAAPTLSRYSQAESRRSAYGLKRVLSAA